MSFSSSAGRGTQTMRLWGGDQGRSRGRPPARRGDVPLLGRRVVIRRSLLTAVDRIAFDIVPPGAWVMEATINLVFDAVVCAVVTVGRHMATSVTCSCRPSGRPATWGSMHLQDVALHAVGTGPVRAIVVDVGLFSNRVRETITAGLRRHAD